MYSIDLTNLLKQFGNKGMDKISVYGRITRPLQRPANINKDVRVAQNNIFVEMQVFAINLKAYENFLKEKGIWNKDSVYMVNGSLITLINPSGVKLPEWYTISGTIRYGSKDLSNSYVCILNYRKSGNIWGIEPCTLEDIEIGDWDESAPYKDYLRKGYNSDTVIRPDSVRNLPMFNSELFVNKPVQPAVPEAVVAQAQAYVSGDNFVKESREDIKPVSEKLAVFEDNYSQSKSILDKTIKNIKTHYNNFEGNETHVRRLVQRLTQYIRTKPGKYASTGRVLLSKYLENFKESSKKYIGNQTAGDFLIGLFPDMENFIVDNSGSVNCDGVAWTLCKAAFADGEKFYAGIFGEIFGISYDTMEDIYDFCCRNDLNFIQIVNENPYVLQFISDLGYSTIESIALAYGKASDSKLSNWSSIAKLNDFINSSDMSNTFFTKSQLSATKIGIRLTSAQYSRMQSTGFYLPMGVAYNCSTYLSGVDVSKMGYPLDRFRAQGNGYTEVISTAQAQKIIDDYMKSGLGVSVEDGLTSTKLMEKEIFVYNTMRELGEKRFEYSDAEIDECIDRYEQLVGFKLEAEQRQAVHLVKNGAFIVAGSAGSGKTTTTNCIVYVLEHLDPTLEMSFAAPTGKASKRMQEVTKREAKTWHSTFKIGMSRERLFDKNEESEVVFGGRVYFLDEAAMSSLDLMYSVLKRIDTENSRVVLSGDFNQLPPIGKGLPFKNLLRFMPCVFLRVSKRAADGSNITRNSDFINEHSETGNWTNLESGDDFLLLPCKEESINEVVKDICSYFIDGTSLSPVTKMCMGDHVIPDIGNVSVDDIQVVSPVAKTTYPWGATRLNTVLQPLFNKTRGIDKTYIYKLTNDGYGTRFVFGDRVIHTTSNMYSMQWYSSYKNGLLQKTYGFGICNGEVGKFVDVLDADCCEILDEEGDAPEDFDYPANIRNDSNWHGLFFVVEYHDYISDENFYILYRAEENRDVEENRGTAIKGDDITKLSLFYAGTTHKLQGSQSKVIIFTLGNVNYQGFINRQMIYTMITRGEKLVIGVGSVDNSQSSMLTRARKDVSQANVPTIGELLG